MPWPGAPAGGETPGAQAVWPAERGGIWFPHGGGGGGPSSPVGLGGLLAERLFRGWGEGVGEGGVRLRTGQWKQARGAQACAGGACFAGESASVSTETLSNFLLNALHSQVPTFPYMSPLGDLRGHSAFAPGDTVVTWPHPLQRESFP